MTDKEYLGSVVRLRRRIEYLNDRLAEYKAAAESPTKSNFGTIRVQQTINTEAPFINSLQKVGELEEKLQELMTLYDKRQAEVIDTIESQLDDEDAKTIIVLRYLGGNSWETIAQKMDMSRWTAVRRHNSAIEKLKFPTK